MISFARSVIAINNTPVHRSFTIGPKIFRHAFRAFVIIREHTFSITRIEFMSSL